MLAVICGSALSSVLDWFLSSVMMKMITLVLQDDNGDHDGNKTKGEKRSHLFQNSPSSVRFCCVSLVSKDLN